MVSSDSSTELSGSDSGSGSGSSVNEREKRFYSRPNPSRQPLSSSSSPSSFPSPSPSASSAQISTLSHKKTPSKIPSRTPTTPSKPSPSSAKRPRTEEEEPANKKAKKPKPTKEERQKSNGDSKRKGKKPEPLPSPQISTAKKPNVWNPKEEIDFLKALAGYCQDGKDFPKNSMTPVYDYVRSLNMLGHDYSNSQLGEKFRRLRAKFFTMRDNVKGGGYSFKNAHDEVLYKMCKKIWGKEEDEEDSEEQESEEQKEEEVGNGIKEDRVVKEEEEVEDEKDVEEEESESTGEDMEMTQTENDEVEEEGEEDETNTKQHLLFPEMRKPHVVSNGTISNGVKEAVATPHVVSNGTISNGVKDNKDGELIDQLRKENSVMMNEIKDQLSTEIKEFKTFIVNMVREGLHSSVNGKTSNSIGFSSEEAVKKNCSAREFPKLDDSEAKLLEQKWQRQLLVELEACSGHLALLQEECQKRTEKLLSLVDEDRH